MSQPNKSQIELAHYDPSKHSYRSVAKKIIVEIPLANATDTVGSVLNKIKTNITKLKFIDYVYVINENKNLIGTVSFKNLFRSTKEIKIGKLMQKKLVTVSPETDQEKVADLAVKHNLKAIPVIEHKKLVGAISIEQILPILNRALREDLLHLAGIHKAHLNYENTLAVPLFLSVLHRIPYLLVGLLGITIAAIFISVFEATLQKNLILAFFIPAIVYMSDALGTQHQTLFIRDLAILGKELNLKIYFLKHLSIGALLALVISGVIFLVISFFWGQPFMAFIIAIAMFASLVFTSSTALIITQLMAKLKLDPALGGGPIATIISDVTSIIIYFGIAIAFLKLV
ncbi:MAG: magnesium transporter [Nanoarchaeota archaeon]